MDLFFSKVLNIIFVCLELFFWMDYLYQFHFVLLGFILFLHLEFFFFWSPNIS